MTRPLVLIHGYSSTGDAFDPVRDALVAEYKKRNLELSLTDINICTYISLNNEITIPDIAEGLDRAFREHPVLKEAPEFDAIVHSTGMLVVRSWLVNHGATVENNPRLKRLKHIVGLAPATWGSPQAALGRTWLGALIKGPKNFGPDFLNAGNKILEGLELGSSFLWNLAHEDLLGPQSYYNNGPDTPLVSVFIGNKGYDGIASFANSPGSDGTVRWAGCNLTTSKITLDLTSVSAPSSGMNPRISIHPKRHSNDIPIIPVDDRCHSTLLSDPEEGVISLIVDFLQIAAPAATAKNADISPHNALPPSPYDSWLRNALSYGEKGFAQMLVDPSKGLSVADEAERFFGHLVSNPTKMLDGWQQFILHVVDANGQGVDDFFLELVSVGKDGAQTQMQSAFDDVHAFGPDSSFRCFHLKLPKGITQGIPKLLVRLHASTGTDIVCYQGYGDIPQQLSATAAPVELDISSLAQEVGAFFAPFRTTLIEIRLNREPLPLQGKNKVLYFLSQQNQNAPAGWPSQLG